MIAKLAVLTVSVAAMLVACASFTEGDPEVEPTPDASTPDAEDASAADAADGPVNEDAPDPVDAALGCQGAPECERVVFVTSTVTRGSDLLGINEADSLCNLRASLSMNVRVQGHTFRAWLSTAVKPVTEHLVHGTMSYVLPDRTAVASNWEGFASDTHMTAIGLDENGAPFTSTGVGVWTGSTNEAQSSQNDCGGWIASGIGVSGERGFVSTDTNWSDSGSDDCAVARHLYCIEY